MLNCSVLGVESNFDVGNSLISVVTGKGLASFRLKAVFIVFEYVVCEEV